MAHFHDNALVGASGQGGYQISRSLRFDSASGTYLHRTPSVAGNQSTYTLSLWMKRTGLLASALDFGWLGAGDGTQYGISGVGAFGASYNGKVFIRNGGVNVGYWDIEFRDPSAWYHFVLAIDVNQATPANRNKLYVNGVLQPNPNGNLGGATNINNTTIHSIGTFNLLAGPSPYSGYYANGLLAEYYFIDGQQLTPSSFGETDTITGVWKPKKVVGMNYGTNGFYLNFSDNSNNTAATLGKDYSGNGNNWTPVNFSVTAGAGNDSLIDTPTPYADGGNGRGNYCTLNPLDVTSGTFSNGNLDYALNAGRGARGTIFRSTGKWYFEAVITAGTNPEYVIFGIQRNSGSLGSYGGTTQIPDGYGYLGVAGSKYTGSTGSSYGNTFTTNDVIGVAYDLDAGKVWFSKNGTWQASGDPAAGTNAAFTSITAGEYAPYVSNQTTSNNNHTGVTNFGQRPFAYTPPSGFVALNTQNLPEPSIKKPSAYMDVKLYSGTGASQSITGLGFSPDLIWFKNRTGTAYHGLFDSVRGRAAGLSSNVTDAESTSSAGNDLVSFDANGFTLGPVQNWNSTNGSGNSIVAWCWDESATPGFDIVTYTGTGSATTVAHSLGVAPSMIVIKCRSNSSDWATYHTSVGATKGLGLNLTNAAFTTSDYWNNTAPTSSVFTVGTNTDLNGSGRTYVAYLWSEVAGFSKFGSYTGNGSSDGPFVFCGFRPRWVMIKRTDSTQNWPIVDSSRDSYNIANRRLFANLIDAEDQGISNYLDLLSNGFKCRDSNVSYNASGGTYVFAAFSESALKYSLAR